MKVKVLSIVLSILLVINYFAGNYRLFMSFSFTLLWFKDLIRSLVIDYIFHGVVMIILLILPSFYCHHTCLIRLKKHLINSKAMNMAFCVKTMLFVDKNVKLINSIIGPVVLITFVSLYIYSVVLIFVFSNFGTEFIYIIIIICIFKLFVLCIIVLSQRSTSSLNSIRSEILEMLLLNRNNYSDINSIQGCFLLDILQKENLLTYTAMDVFNMDYNMLLCFLGSLISISVLFCQLTLTSWS